MNSYENNRKTVYAVLIEENVLNGSKEIMKLYEEGNASNVRVVVENRCIFICFPEKPEDNNNGDETGQYIEQYAMALENVCRMCAVNNISNLYVFIKANMPMALLAGEKFANKFVVHMHHWAHKEKKYGNLLGYFIPECFNQDAKVLLAQAAEYNDNTKRLKAA